jgi:DNA replication protein DnaD
MHLNTVQEIERAIDALTPQQIEELYAWLDQRHPQLIDAQLKADLNAGRIDDRINRALADHKAGNTQPL